MAEDVKSSTAAWGGRDETSVDNPPAYSGAVPAEPSDQQPNPETSVRRRPVPRTPYDPLRRLAAFAQVPHHKYNIPDGTLSRDKVSITVKHADLYAHPQHLLPFILEQAHLPPKPTLRIVGSTSSEMRVDFDLTLNLTHLIDLATPKWYFSSAQVAPIGGARSAYQRDDPSIPQRVAGAVKQFCQDRSENKSFSLTRRVEGLPTEMLAGQVRNLAASIKYRGLLRIDFTDERSRVTVHKQPSSWFSNVLRLYEEKKYEVVETGWSLSDGSEGGVEADQSAQDVALRAGQEWWQSWAPAIRNAMIGKHKGNIGVDDWLEARMGQIEADPRADWGREYST